MAKDKDKAAAVADPLTIEDELAAEGFNVAAAKDRVALVAGSFPKENGGIPEATLFRLIDESGVRDHLNRLLLKQWRTWEG